MPEGVIRPIVDQEQEEALPMGLEIPAQAAIKRDDQASGEEPERGETSDGKIIWTPAFLLTFALVVVLGLSLESLFTQLWDNGIIDGQRILMGHVMLVALGWLSLGIAARSRWIRVGCVFGGIWALFMALNIITNIQGIDPSTQIQSSINVAICMSLLGTFIGLSIENTLLTRWDTWLFLLVPGLSALGVTLIYFLTPQASIMTVENALATCALIACCLFWWLRPACWRKRPGPTFLFGLVPAILLVAALLNGSMHDFFLLEVLNSRAGLFVIDNNFFFAQLVLLCLLLGCMRLRQGEKVK